MLRLFAVVLLALGLYVAGPAHAQDSINCGSTDNRYQECRGFRGRAVLIRQLSDSRCIEGRSWGQRDGILWVSQGCRGQFAEERRDDGGRWGDRGDRGDRGGRGDRWGRDPNYSVTCSSDDNRRHLCDWDDRNGRPVVIKQLSKTACVEGSTWAYRNGQLWVDDGCRARFGGR